MRSVPHGGSGDPVLLVTSVASIRNHYAMDSALRDIIQTSVSTGINLLHAQHAHNPNLPL